MHLGKFYWPVRGGIETALRQISEAGVKLGYSVICWVSQNDGSQTHEDSIQQVKLKRFSSFGNLLSVPLSFGLFFEHKPHFSILHVHLPHPIAELYTLFFIRNKKIRIIPYLHAFPVGHGLLGRIWFQLITYRILSRSHRILISNPEMKNIVPSLNRFSSKIVILPFSTESIEEEERKNILKNREENKILLTVGRVVPYKGYQNLLEAWGKFLALHPEYQAWKLVIIGDGPELPSLKQWASKNLSPQNILFTGICNDDEKKDWLKKATVFILSSLTTAETFGISLLEAFGMGLPAIVSNLTGGVSTLARKGECGAVFDLTSQQDLINSFSSILSSPENRNSSGQKNLQFAQKNFSSQQLLNTYQDALHAK